MQWRSSPWSQLSEADPAGAESDAALAWLREAIAEAAARRSALKAEMQAWYEAGRKGRISGGAGLARVDEALS